MTYTITPLPDGTTKLCVDFADEGVALQGTTYVVGDESVVIRYLPTFEQDLRTNYAHRFPRFPTPEPEVEG